MLSVIMETPVKDKSQNPDFEGATPEALGAALMQTPREGLPSDSQDCSHAGGEFGTDDSGPRHHRQTDPKEPPLPASRTDQPSHPEDEEDPELRRVRESCEAQGLIPTEKHGQPWIGEVPGWMRQLIQGDRSS